MIAYPVHRPQPTRPRLHPETRVYETQRITEGKTHRAIRRSAQPALAPSTDVEAAIRANNAPIAA